MKPPINETSHKRFKRLATARTNKVLRDLRVLGNLSNRHRYEYKREEINKIFNEIERKMRKVRSRFRFLKEKEFKL